DLDARLDQRQQDRRGAADRDLERKISRTAFECAVGEFAGYVTAGGVRCQLKRGATHEVMPTRHITGTAARGRSGICSKLDSKTSIAIHEVLALEVDEQDHASRVHRGEHGKRDLARR